MQLNQRIPEINHAIGPQETRMVDEGYLGVQEYELVQSVKWVERQRRIDQSIEMGAPQPFIDSDSELLNRNITSDAKKTFDNHGAARAFNRLISRQAMKSGVIIELAERTNTEIVIDAEYKLLRAAYGKVDPECSTYDFASVLTDETASIEHKRELIRLHTDAIVDAATQLEMKIPELRKEFDFLLLDAIEKGIIPASANPGENEPARFNRLAELRFVVSDPVLNRLMERGGHYSAIENAVHIDAQTVIDNDGGEGLRSVFFHEMLHAYSGLSVRLENKSSGIDFGDRDSLGDKDIHDAYRDTPDWDKSAYVNVGRVGLRGQSNSRILNEAYTEWASMYLRGYGYESSELWNDYKEGKLDPVKYGKIYLYERVIMAGIEEMGVDMMTIGEAYFESYQPKSSSPDREPGNTLPARRRLDALVAEKTDFKSMEQLLMYLETKSRQYKPKALNLRIFQASLVADNFSM